MLESIFRHLDMRSLCVSSCVARLWDDAASGHDLCVDVALLTRPVPAWQVCAPAPRHLFLLVPKGRGMCTTCACRGGGLASPDRLPEPLWKQRVASAWIGLGAVGQTGSQAPARSAQARACCCAPRRAGRPAVPEAWQEPAAADARGDVVHAVVPQAANCGATPRQPAGADAARDGHRRPVGGWGTSVWDPSGWRRMASTPALRHTSLACGSPCCSGWTSTTGGWV
eukprot:352887-Chlamydomonas_euryale.AAC.3